MERYASKLLPEHTKLKITFKGKKPNSCFSIKDKTKFEHQHDVVYYVNCTEASCRDNNVGETGCMIIEKIKDHSGRDHASHMVFTLLTSKSLISVSVITKENGKLLSLYGLKT